jgi:hypothetical protein
MNVTQNLSNIVTYISMENTPPNFSPVVNETLEHIRRRIGAGLTPDELMNVVWNSTSSILPHDRIGLSFIDYDGQRVTSHYFRTAYNHASVKLGADYSAGLANSSLRDILDKGTARIIHDLGDRKSVV